MNQAVDTDTEGCVDLGVTAESRHAPLKECVEHALHNYFQQLNGTPTANLYDMLMTEVEVPLLRATLEHTHGNQCRAAEILGINRGTLRKKLKQYGL